MRSKKDNAIEMSGRGMSRRDFLTDGLTVTAACFLPYKALAAVSDIFLPEKALSFYNTHTGEDLKAVFWSDGAYLPQTLNEINHILRDHRTGEEKEIDTGLFELLFDLSQKLQSREPFHIISGYRSPQTNSTLNAASSGVARNSLHIKGMAIDVRLPGHELKTLKRAALDLRGGGVGYYPSSDFVHVDVGRVRYW
ncbi:MAG: hypothetical protein A2X59_12435 [Nitrospirae bacterium GWC2_42_7]|nr:MAG: hypothetical protein A2X59_12435 [Nitrospirae bacterium GWC2_42_7]